jgi:hypothetical protein
MNKKKINRKKKNAGKRKVVQQRVLLHFTQRARERFDLGITEDLKNRIVKAIQKQRMDENIWVKFLKKETNSRTMWLVVVNKEKAMRVIYSGSMKAICTALPLNNYSKKIITQEFGDGQILNI